MQTLGDLMRRRPTALVLGFLAGILSGAVSSALAAGPELDFNRDIRPILADNCYACHGSDAAGRKAGLRLDTFEGATAARDGAPAIVPGDLTQSELLFRIDSADTSEVMPPPRANRILSSEQKEKLRRWIAEGAKYQVHWAFVPLVPTPLPQVLQSAWPRNAIDRFILARLEGEGLGPSAEAGKATLIRRVSLDLTGLPPAPHDVNAFLADDSPLAYEQVVDRLLHSPHYGERMAVDWLDAARYADTNGYQVDRDRQMWAWRDWVIRAFNQNMPFDRFTIEQLAGDLLPEPTLEQRIATGFHRNHMVNEETGSIPEEFLAEYTADRVETTAAVWLGQTFNCTRCHDHKFDPFTQRDFYGFKAFFHNVPEKGVADHGKSVGQNNPPFEALASPDGEARLAVCKANLLEGRQALAALDEEASQEQRDEASRQVKSLANLVKEAEAAIPTTLVMQEMDERRPTFILLRGAYDKPGERVEAATPGVLAPLDPDLPRNRLGLARWLVSPRNPLTARVTVNRLWQSVFGTGLVKTSEDFGAQGDLPSHPELLDWLAGEFIRSGWDVKNMLKLLVTSATYRQQSRVTPLLRDRDPENRLLARGARFRLTGEFVRDQALAAGGLLIPAIGGPSVRPYHPAGLYEQVTATGKNAVRSYVPDRGSGLYRRSIYTYWKRSVPNPAMLAFDAPFRENCTLRRPRTNTPLQALNLMNDPTYVEASRSIAQRMVQTGDADAIDARLTYGFRLVLSRSPDSGELAALRRGYERALRDFKADPLAAAQLLQVGETPVDTKVCPAELAALASVASTILCLDEAVTKE